MPTRQQKIWIRALAGLALLGLAFMALFITAEQISRKSETTRAEARLSLYHSTLTAALDRYRHLPYVLAQDPLVQAGARGIGIPTLNIRLAALAARTDLEAVYLMDATGRTIAASNYAKEINFIGQFYGFRPYFLDAMAGKSGAFFAIGVTTNRPGYFLADPVLEPDTGRIIGVIAIKVDLSSLVAAWAEGGENVFVSNDDGVVVLSSNPDWRYHALAPIPPERLAEIAEERQFLGRALEPLDWLSRGDNRAELDGRGFLHLTRPILPQNWTLHFLVPETRIAGRAWTGVGAVGTVLLLLAAVALFWRSERMRGALALSQADRRKLAQANRALEREIDERRAAERRLEQAQAELHRASKLAALGQLSASVTHELGQPIAAMKNHLAAAQIGATPEETRLATRLSRIIARMEGITRELRFFARPSPDNFTSVDLLEVWQGARELTEGDLTHRRITLDVVVPDAPVMVHGNALRLEQVVVNLLRNAMGAMDDSETRKISMSLSVQNDRAQIEIRDTGHGLGGQKIETLQEPFHTTRASGEGMGLGLAIAAEIVKEHQGRLIAADWDGGAVFIIDLPLSAAKDDAA